MDCITPGFPVHHQHLEFAQTHVHRVSDAVQPSHPLSSPFSPTFNLSQHQGLSQWVSSSHQWPKYWSFSLSISPSKEYSGLISFRIDWFDLLATQGTFKRNVITKWRMAKNCNRLRNKLDSLVAQTVKHLPAMPETRVQSLGRENPLEKEMATHSSILAWEIPWTEEPGGLQSMGSQGVGHDWATSLSLSRNK